MKQQFVSYELAVKLKERGFNEPCFGYYNEKDEFQVFADINWYNTNSTFRFFPTAPLHQQAFEWVTERLRSKYPASSMTVQSNGSGIWYSYEYRGRRGNKPLVIEFNSINEIADKALKLI